MPIVRTFQCGECFHRIEVTLDGADWEAPPPDCPMCAAREMEQQFKPIAIGGSNRAKAVSIAQKIVEEDYGVADIQADGKRGGVPKVRYKDQTPAQASTWGVGGEVLAKAVQSGRALRQQGGDGLDILQGALKSGAQPDLIEASKRRAMKIW